ncbi:cytochrome P450 2D15-like [Ambystoma mexicanum]|uniref:cytochrome P450 2D15-like n=1 Tax=Ambystoma mexicanum TaxID=8296 RepID=UPI0037E83EC4
MELPTAQRPPPPPSWSSPTLWCLFFAVFLLCLDFMKRRRRWPRYPPGPTSLPFLGNMLQVDFSNPVASFAKLRKKYGDVFSLQFCWTNAVVLNGFEVMKEALIHKSEDIADRPPFPIFEHLGFKEHCEGVLAARYGRDWKEQRRFSLSTLRNFGLGKKSLEERVIEEAGFLCSAFAAEEGIRFDPHYVVNNAVSNVICSITFGDRFEYDDEKFRRLLHLFEESMKAETGFLPQVLNVVPGLVHIPGIVQKLFQPEKELLRFISDCAQDHKATRDPSITRDLIDAFFHEMEKAGDDPESSFNEQNLLFTAIDIFAAGTETTSTTLRWGLMFMLLHPDIQSQVQQEIDHVIGRARSPVMEDQASMPYTTAVIHEIQRYGDILPIALPHMAYRDTKIQGFFIPKGTTIITNLSSVLKDERVWEKPDQFHPEHFLDKDGHFLKREAFMAFSAGRRVCLGEQLAKMELFLFFTSLLQRFRFSIPEEEVGLREDSIFAITRMPRPYQLCAKQR